MAARPFGFGSIEPVCDYGTPVLGAVLRHATSCPRGTAAQRSNKGPAPRHGTPRGGGSCLTMRVAAVCRGNEAADMVERLLWGHRKRDARIHFITTDRGFRSMDVMRAAQGMNVPAAIPAVKTRRIKGCIREYDAGKRGRHVRAYDDVGIE